MTSQMMFDRIAFTEMYKSEYAGRGVTAFTTKDLGGIAHLHPLTSLYKLPDLHNGIDRSVYMMLPGRVNWSMVGAFIAGYIPVPEQLPLPVLPHPRRLPSLPASDFHLWLMMPLSIYNPFIDTMRSVGATNVVYLNLPHQQDDGRLIELAFLAEVYVNSYEFCYMEGRTKAEKDLLRRWVGVYLQLRLLGGSWESDFDFAVMLKKGSGDGQK